MWLLASLLTLTARAAPEGAVDALAEAESGEYKRLSEELDALASKSAWVGVERTFQQLLTTGVRPNFEQWIRAAEAAKALGDVTSVRERLAAANALQEDRQVIEWLWDLDQRYGPVALRCDPNSYIALAASDSALDPDIRRAIAYAQAQIHDNCRFEGLLPAGRYLLHESAFEVRPKQPSIVLDLRGLPIDKPTRRKLKEAWLQDP